MKPTISKGPLTKNQKEAINKEKKPSQGFTQFPSAKLTNIKTVDPFEKQKGNSFAHLYSSGAIPCKIEHGSVNMKIKWNAGTVIESSYLASQELPYNPLLVTCIDGLTQEKHPYGFIAYHVSRDMILDEESPNKLIDILTKIVWPLRMALSSKQEKVSTNALEILGLLSDKVGSHLNSHVKNLVTPIKKQVENKNLKEKALEVLRKLQDNGGPQVNKIIKNAIPTYSNS